MTVIATTVLAGLATPAVAWVPPTRTETDRQQVLTNPVACGNYGVEWSIDLHSVNWTFFDDKGRRVKLVQHITEDNTVRNTVTGLTLPDSPVDFVQTSTFDPETGLRQRIYINGTSVTVRRGTEHLVDRGPIVIDGQTGKILFAAGPHPVRRLLDGSFDITRALPAFCDILR
ncbi:hypothetical protein EV193_10272 [Herbihabitans rhizosphaerae]|uniref:Uncharacterized protein n=1 Tax=Herbihabitans rhizosphaerae TaxID=1872711 RepID=A0A4Q7L201_9PSEU|nr:hypothetical protein [Herbihabitans rhizosphaerae]RZS43096.1 hypothetical protein EV193_10272 [Herbihabitans rhizosphaerae]